MSYPRPGIRILKPADRYCVRRAVGQTVRSGKPARAPAERREQSIVRRTAGIHGRSEPGILGGVQSSRYRDVVSVQTVLVPAGRIGHEPHTHLLQPPFLQQLHVCQSGTYCYRRIGSAC